MNRTVNPELISLARESRGITQGELARAIGVSQGTISKYESGINSPPNDDLGKIAKELNYPESFFFQAEDVRGVGSTCLYHRKRQSMPVRELKIIQAKVNIVRMQMAKLIRGVEIKCENVFPRMDVEEYDGGPEEIAALVRKAWGLQPGPIPHMVNAIEDVGGIAFRWPFGNRKLDAISQCVPGLPPLFFVNSQAPNDRVRYSLAHELGHVVMHRVPTPDQEREADRFAAEFLMPAKDIGPFLRPLSVQKAAAMKPHWKVSMAALIKRAYDLGKISDSYYRKLFTQLGKLNYRTTEPVELPDEEPTILRDIIGVHLNDHHYSTMELASALSLHESEFLEQYMPGKRTFKIVD
jgi:Zn-dependent peptidase ImmA (M78 family)/transcriptional regulator with XRE-family HTH domain